MSAPRDRRRLARSLTVWAVLAAIVLLDQTTAARMPPLDVAFLQFLIPIATAVWGFFQAAGHITLVVLQGLFFAFRTAMIFTARALRTGLWTLAKSSGKVLGLFRSLYTHVLRPALQWVSRKLVALERYLKQSFEPLFRQLRRAREFIDRIYKTWVRPILDVIDIVRAMNRVLRVFHIDLLQTLDAVLAQIERRIEQPFQWIYRRLVDIEEKLTWVVTGGGLFQRATLIRSLARDVRLTTNLWWHQVHRPLTPEDLARLNAGVPALTVDQVTEDARQYLLQGGGPDRARIDEAALDVELRIRHLRFDSL